MSGRHFVLVVTIVLSLLQVCVAAPHEPESKGSVVAFDHWVSGEPLPIGTNNRRGPLAPGVTFWPLGFASISGGDEPDMFMGTDRFSHPSGIYHYRFSGRDVSTGVPVFEEPELVKAPFNPLDEPIVFEDRDGAIYGVWHEGKELRYTRFNAETMAFEGEETLLDVSNLPRSPSSIWIVPQRGANGSTTHNSEVAGKWLAVLAVGDGKPHRPVGPNWRQPEYSPYDGRGIYRGNLNEYVFYGVSFDWGSEGQWLGKISPDDRATLMSCDAITDVDLGDGRTGSLIAGTKLGGIYYFPASWNGNRVSYDQRLRAVDTNGNAIRFPSVHAYVSSYSNPETGHTDLLIGTQGLTMYYEFTGEFTEKGEPMFSDPSPVLVESAGLQLGALAVPNIVDWDQDGVLDIIAGNSDGYVMFSRNKGTNRDPKIAPGVRVQADGHDIHVQPGYYDIQGPGEARWGYSCPTTVDWDGDGDIDIVMSDPTAAHTVFINRGGAGNPPVLDRGSHLYWEHLDLHGTWRVRPAAAMMGDNMSYVMLDSENELRLYWRLDDYNVEDRGKILQPDGKPISGAYLHSGGTGRLKLLLYDWDGDGVTDVITGTSRHASVGDANNGLPQSLGRPGSSVLYLRNVGTNEEPVLEWPRVMSFKGLPIFFGQHSCAPAIGPMGPGDEDNLILGTEDGRVLFFAREDIEFLTIDEVMTANRKVIIDRLFANPDEVSDEVGEWMSLKNVSEEDVDIHGWWLYSRGTRQILRNRNGDTILSPGESLIIGRSDDTSVNGGVEVEHILDDGIGLSNNKGIIGLYSHSGVHDAVRWGEGSEELLKSEVSQNGFVHGVAEGTCRVLGGSFKPGEVRSTE